MPEAQENVPVSSVGFLSSAGSPEHSDLQHGHGCNNPCGTSSVVITVQECNFSSTGNFDFKNFFFFFSKPLPNNSLFTDLHWEMILSSLELANKHRSPAISVHINHQDNG